MPSLDEVLEGYRLFLEVKKPEHFSAFQHRGAESARAEAAIFSWFRSTGRDVEIAEDPATGGPDFLVSASNSALFLAEVTNLKTEAVAANSGLKTELSEPVEAFSFSLITEVLRARASAKAKQLSKAEIPRLLVITCQHRDADLILGPNAAEELLVGGSAIRVPLGADEPSVQTVTHLRDSVFFRFDDEGSVEPARRSISAILLVALGSHQAQCLGILNPEPALPFDFQLLREIPFLRVQGWPMESRSVRVEWVMGQPPSATWHFEKVELTDEELRAK